MGVVEGLTRAGQLSRASACPLTCACCRMACFTLHAPSALFPPPPKTPPVCLHFHMQVETRQCFEALDEVLSVPGITCAFLGEGREPNLLLNTWGTSCLICWRCTCLSTNSLPHDPEAAAAAGGVAFCVSQAKQHQPC